MPDRQDLRIPTTTKDLLQAVFKGGGVKKPKDQPIKSE